MQTNFKTSSPPFLEEVPVLNGHAAISPEIALRLEKAGWSNAEFWLRRQTTYDLVQVRKDTGSISNDSDRGPHCEASHNRFLPANMKGGRGGKAHDGS